MNYICLILALVNSAGLQDDTQTELKAFRNAYESNRTVLSTFGTIRFEFSVGYAKSMDALLQNEWSQRFVAEGLFVFDGKSARYEVVFPNEAIVGNRRKTGPNTYSNGPVRSIRVLTNGDLTLWDHIYVAGDDVTVSHTAQIDKGIELFYREVIAPINVGKAAYYDHDLAQDIDRAAQGGGWNLEAVEDVTLEGANATSVTFRRDNVQRRYWLDLARSAIPLRIVDSGPQPTGSFTIEYDDIRRVDDKGWLPFKESIFFSGVAKQLVIKEVNFTERPAGSMFRLEFSKPSRVTDSVRGCRYDPDETVFDLNRLPSMDGERTIKISASADPAVAPVFPGPREARSWWFYWLPAVGLSLIVIGVWAIWRRTHA